MTFIVSIEMDSDKGGVYHNFRTSIMRYPEVTQCYQISGSYDFLLIVCVRDIPEYENFIEGSLRSDLNVRKFHTSISLRTVKFSTEVNLSRLESD
jgi:Lrp/AsnC family leucine-responsive transcriptional regulator